MRIEPELLPIVDTSTSSTNVADKARLDVSAVGVWSPMERTFFDVRVVHPNAPSYNGKDVEKIYQQNEREKKSKYNQRVIQVEKATFTPLVFTTTGGMAPECTKFHKKVAELISWKTKEEYSQVMNHIRTRIRFTLLKSTLIAIRGERGKSRKVPNNISDVSFNMVPPTCLHTRYEHCAEHSCYSCQLWERGRRCALVGSTKFIVTNEVQGVKKVNIHCCVFECGV